MQEGMSMCEVLTGTASPMTSSAVFFWKKERCHMMHGRATQLEAEKQ